MGFIYSKRVRAGKNTSINVGNSGVSVSKRTKWGSFGTRGFSIKTGVPGLTFRKSYGRGKNALPMLLLFITAYATIGISYLIISNIFRFIIWLIGFSVSKIAAMFKE